MKTTIEASQPIVRSAWQTPVSAAIGGSLGAFICFPFEGLKKKIQSEQVKSFHPRELYRGSTAFAVSVTFATVAAMSFNRGLKTLPGYDHSSPAWNGVSAITSGMLGAVVGSTPVENIILVQQLNKTSPVNAIRIMMKQGPTRLWVGLPELAVREGGFAGVMLWGVEAARKKALRETNSQFLAGVAGIGAGVVGAAFTQPFDTVATIKQKSNGLLSTSQAIQQIRTTQGKIGLIRGLSQRVFLFTGCAILIPEIEKIASDRLNNKQC